ncbi:MAG: hypothetical protein NTY23_15665, partial [Chloroflexi bacterium]|nr:hypothetical protein [Chloroflexota bacterium]
LLVAALLTTRNYAAAAKACGISKTTVCRRMQDEDFKRAFRAARRQLVEATIGRLQRVSEEAVATLRAALRCRAPSVRVSAARTILDFSLRGVELMDLEDRVAALEQRFADQESGRA